MATALPIHPITGLRAIYVSEKTGRAYWPILGAEDNAGAAGGSGTATGGDGAAGSSSQSGQGGSGTTDGSADQGFPANTALEQMKPEQREAYWKHQARKHEDRVKAYGGRTPEQIAEAFDKASKHDALELELGTTADKAAAKAADEAKAAARGEYQPALITARLDAAAARAGVSEADLAKAVEFVDTAKFLTAEGQINTDKVKAFIEAIKPVRGNQQDRRGPSATGHNGSGPGSSATGSARDKGRAEAERRFGKPA